MPKVNRHGRAEIWTDTDLAKLRKATKNPRHLLILDLLQYTGERIGAVCKLLNEDCYEPDGSPRTNILFRAKNRKGTKSGARSLREVPCHHLLKQSLSRFDHEKTGYLFPSPFIPDKSITTASVDRWFRAALERAGLGGRGYSLHSFRRTCLTVLRKKGCSVRLIQQFSGHRSLDSLQNYLDCGDGELAEVVELL